MRHILLFCAIFMILYHATAIETTTFAAQTIEPGSGGSFPTNRNTDSGLKTIRYYLSVLKSNGYPPEATSAELDAWVFLGRNLTAGDHTTWNNDTIQDDWSKIKFYKAVDPCQGAVGYDSVAWILVDAYNVSLTIDAVVGTEALPVLTSGNAFKFESDSSIGTTDVSTPGLPLVCDQFFMFDFSSEHAPENGFSWSFTLESNVPIPYSKAIISANGQCPNGTPNTTSNAWFEILLSPLLPGNSPTKFVVSNLAPGTFHQQWWIKLEAPANPINAKASLSITPTFQLSAPTPLNPTPNTPPTQSPPPEGTPSPWVINPDVPSPGNPPPVFPGPDIPTWGIVIISIGSMAIAASALIWAWCQTRKPEATDSYEIY